MGSSFQVTQVFKSKVMSGGYYIFKYKGHGLWQEILRSVPNVHSSIPICRTIPQEPI